MEDSYTTDKDIAMNFAMGLACDIGYYFSTGDSELDQAQIFGKLLSELKELQEAIEYKNEHEIADELGDCFVVLTRLALAHNIDPRSAILQAVNKCNRRLDYMKRNAGEQLHSISHEQRKALFKEAKQYE